MKDKIISGMLGVLLGAAIVLGYSALSEEDKKGDIRSTENRTEWKRSDLSDEKLIEMAESQGISVEELKEKMGSRERLRGEWRNINTDSQSLSGAVQKEVTQTGSDSLKPVREKK